MGLTGASSTLIAGHWSILPGGEEAVIAGRDRRFLKVHQGVTCGTRWR